MEMLKNAGKSPLAARLDMVARRLNHTHVVFYDDDGFYLRQRARDMDSVLLIAK
jgi:hypothetical protein